MAHEDVATLIGSVLVLGVVAAVLSLVVAPLRALMLRWAIPLAATVATAATLGSLYFSERAGFVPCEYCWYQRIAMYPLAVMLITALVLRDRGVFRYVIPIAVIGILISANHVRIQWFPEQSNSCEITNPCSAKWVEAFGFVTIPQMAGASFALILFVAVSSLLHDRATPPTDAGEPIGNGGQDRHDQDEGPWRDDDASTAVEV